MGGCWHWYRGPANVGISPLRFGALPRVPKGPGCFCRGDRGKALDNSFLLPISTHRARILRAGGNPLRKRSPMTAEQQLERSVLEGKERDELSAIAQAMSLKTTTRTKKADIIDQILDATGLTSGPGPGESSNGDAGTNGTKPARRSRASAAARGAADAASFVSGDGDAGGSATADAGDD